ncbi:protein of unknown function (plasmid) [Candidatus Methylocalor cossyra]|uniref:Uncharacterized protein n=1 Tax=Candidatus Methylocalor cossyra TaxID=3108543 RepID=A0ABM9NN64_9GAMM
MVGRADEVLTVLECTRPGGAPILSGETVRAMDGAHRSGGDDPGTGMGGGVTSIPYDREIGLRFIGARQA